MGRLATLRDSRVCSASSGVLGRVLSLSKVKRLRDTTRAGTASHQSAIAQSPLGLGHPHLANDAAFDIDLNVRYFALPKPGDDVTWEP